MDEVILNTNQAVLKVGGVCSHNINNGQFK